MADQQVTTTRGASLTTSALKESAIQNFRASLSGAVLLRGDAGYETRARSGTG